MPLDCANPIDSDLVTDYVSPEKDVDGYVQYLLFIDIGFWCESVNLKNIDFN